MKEKTLNPTAVFNSLSYSISKLAFILLFFIGCNNEQTVKSIDKADTLAQSIKAPNDQLLYAYKFPKSDFEANWNAFKNEKKVIFQFQFDPALGSPNFKLLAYITNHVDYCKDCTPFTLNPTGNGTLTNTTGLIIGNLDLNWKEIVLLIKKGSDIDPDFDHIYLEPRIKTNYLYYDVSLRKANGSIFKEMIFPNPPNAAPPTWDLADANPSPPAKPNE